MRKLANLLAAGALALPLCPWAEIYAYVGLPLTPTQEPDAPASNGSLMAVTSVDCRSTTPRGGTKIGLVWRGLTLPRINLSSSLAPS